MRVLWIHWSGPALGGASVGQAGTAGDGQCREAKAGTSEHLVGRTAIMRPKSHGVRPQEAKHTSGGEEQGVLRDMSTPAIKALG